jgi:DNA gyrase subunit A
MVFTSTGKMYRLNVNDIPEGTNSSNGTNLKTILPFEVGEEVQAVADTNYKAANNVIFFTKKGLIKKTNIEEYLNMKKSSGIQAIKLKEKDKLLSVTFIDDSQEIILITKKGMSIHVPTDDIKPIGRLTSGVKGIGLKEDDEVVAALILSSEKQVAIITTKGKGKRVNIKDFVIQNRGGRGTNCIKLDPDDFVAAAALIESDSKIFIAGKPNSICIAATELAEQSKLGSGVKVIERSTVQTVVKL